MVLSFAGVFRAASAHRVQVMTGISFLLVVWVCSAAGERPQVRTMEVTAYCGCGKCCEWERGSWKYLKLDRWNRYVTKGPRKGRLYDGRTASRTRPRQASPGLLSRDSVAHPWRIPQRLVLPWNWPPRAGTIAADTRHYPFGTRIYVPGYGWGIVEDRGGAIKGPNRLDVYLNSHRKALQWGRQKVKVTIQPAPKRSS